MYMRNIKKQLQELLKTDKKDKIYIGQVVRQIGEKEWRVTRSARSASTVPIIGAAKVGEYVVHDLHTILSSLGMDLDLIYSVQQF